MEAARVLEDLARYCADDAALTDGFKSLRHDLASALASLPPQVRAAHRDVVCDVGTKLQGENEGTRANLAAVAAANGSRLTEALRSLEEIFKVLSTSGPEGGAIESLRYRAYALIAQLALRLRPCEARQWKVCVLLTKSLCRRPWREVLAESIAAGAECVQVREKDLSSHELAAHVREVVAIANASGVCVIVNDRVDVALAAGANGVHLGLSDLSIADARRVAGRVLLIGATVHNHAEATAAVAAGADYCGVGAMFASSVKPDQPPAGPDWMREFAAAWTTTAHLAIGGIDSRCAAKLREVGCRGVAVSTAVCGADDPGAEVARLCAIFV